MREFVTIDGDSSDSRLTEYPGTSQTVYVAEVMEEMLLIDVDEDDRPCSERERNRTVIGDLFVPLYCCRSPQRKLPPRSPEDALRAAAEKNRDGLRIGDTVRLNGLEITL